MGTVNSQSPPSLPIVQQFQLLQLQGTVAAKNPVFPNVFAALQQLQQLQRLLERTHTILIPISG
jgi:hypothetical protein